MRYLVAMDGSTESEEAVAYAAEHAEAFGRLLEIVHVVTPETELIGDEIVLQDRATAAEQGTRTLDRAVTVAEDAADVEVETRLLTGRPADAIAERANSDDVDAVFVGHRGLSSEQEKVVGSVAKTIVSKANTPVTVVR